MICYCIKNKVNNKRYIGITTQLLKDRMKCHERSIDNNSKSAFHCAVRKYNKLNFEFEFINNYTGLITELELKEIEIDMIAKYSTFKEGYNMTIGGDGGLGIPINQYDLDGNFLKSYISLSEAKRLTGISNSSISECLSEKLLTAGGFLWTKLGENPKEYKYSREKSVIQTDKSGQFINKFSSIIEAANKTKVNFGNISSNCRNERMSAGGFVWYFETNKQKLLKYINPNARPILKCDKYWKILEKFDSISEAKRRTKNSSNINKVIKGERDFAGGYRWKYAELE